LPNGSGVIRDRSFIASSSVDGFDTAVIEALLSIGRTIGLSIVAEGIETEEQLEFVKSRGIHRGQGYLLARPTSQTEAERVIFGMAHCDDDLSHSQPGLVLSPMR
jgi:EAL domain-containing protein (putative c-di-GMP-specific phosphodiesterase class I)